MASPPEVYSALLSSGPGPGSLLAAAGAWNSLSTEYTAAADELSAAVAAAQAIWEGPGATSYAAAHVPYVAWLTHAAVGAAAAAAQHETAAGAYTAALAAMPTLAELAANHATHAALTATNFFGINTIPIALNEADYARMWTQAATTMTVYQAVSAAAVTAVPSTPPAPTVLKSSNPASAADILDDISNDWTNFVQTIMDTLFGIQAPPELDSSSTFFPGVMNFLQYPSPALLGALVVAATYEVAFDTLWSSPAALLSTPFLPFAGVAGLVGLVGLAAIRPPGQPATPDSQIPESAPTQTRPAVGAAAAVATPGSVMPTPMGAPTPASAPPSAPAPAPATPATGFGYLVPGGGPDEEEGPTLIDRGTGLPLPAAAAAAVATSARESSQERSQRRRTSVLRGRSHEYMDLDSDLGAPPGSAPAATAASNQGAGPLGLTGTVSKADGIRPEGLVALADGSDGGPTAPRLPQTWGSDRGAESPGSGEPEGYQ